MKSLSFLLLIFSCSAAFAGTQSDSDRLFDWAESQYPHYFSPPGQSSQTWDVWYYRFYPGTDNYLGVNTTALDVHVLGESFAGQERVDTLAALLASAGLTTVNTEQAPCPLQSDEAPISPGPYDHVLKVATSSDGLNFSSDGLTLLEHASAPDAVMSQDDSTWIYYVNGTPGQHAIFIAKSVDGGGFQAFDCIRIDGKVDEKAVDPDVIRLKDGSYRLFYNPLVSPDPSAEEGIFSATSSDGIHFENNTRIFQQAGALNPSGIQLNDGSWLLTFTDESRTYIASSEDGNNFTVISNFSPGIPELIYLAELNEVRFYNAEVKGLIVRSSLDGGVNWTELSASAPGAQDPSLLRQSPSSWLLYYRNSVNDVP